MSSKPQLFIAAMARTLICTGPLSSFQMQPVGMTSVVPVTCKLLRMYCRSFIVRLRTFQPHLIYVTLITVPNPLKPIVIVEVLEYSLLKIVTTSY